MLTLSEWIGVALTGSISRLDSAERSVWVVGWLEGGLRGLGGGLGSEVCLLISELLAISADDNARVCQIQLVFF